MHQNRGLREADSLRGGAAMMNFERASVVLDRLTSTAKVGGDELDSLVQTQLSYLTGQYPKLLYLTRPPVDYSSEATQIAYVYRCAPAHGQWVYHALLAAHSRASKIFSQKVVRVAAIGGGPGSDLLGVMKYSAMMGLAASHISFKLLDHEPAWARVSAEFAATYAGQRSLDVSFERLDLAVGSPWAASHEFLSADIFTFSFSLSEAWVFDGDGSVSAFLDCVISNAKPGALFVYVDNGGPSFSSRVEPHFCRRDVKQIVASDDQRRLLGSDEQSSAVAAYKARFEQSPKLTGNVSYRVWEKLP
jgi:hypothetical protein